MSRLRAGFGEVDITPTTEVGLWWVVGERVATDVRWPLHGRVALFDDGTRRAAIVALDVCGVEAEASERLRAAMAAAGGLAPGDILINSSHTHNSPNTDWGPLQPEFLEPLASGLAQAMAAAVASLEPVELHFGKTTTEQLAFCRRPMYTGDEVASGGPPHGDDFLGFEGPIDEDVQVLVARREDGSIAGGLVGFACHPHIMGPQPVWSADFPGALTEELAGRHGGVFLFLQGASGDLHWVDRSVDSWWTNWWVEPDRLADEPRARAVECVQRHAKGLFAACEAAIASSRRLDGGGVHAASRILEIPRRSPTPEQVELAQRYLDQGPGSIDLETLNRRMSGHPFMFYEDSDLIQGLLARVAVEMSQDEQANGSQPPVERVEVQVITIGDAAVVGYPGELFTAFSLRTKAGSPLPATFVCGQANDTLGYVPTATAFAHGGFETRLGSSPLVPEAGDRMVDAALELLGDGRPR